MAVLDAVGAKRLAKFETHQFDQDTCISSLPDLGITLALFPVNQKLINNKRNCGDGDDDSLVGLLPTSTRDIAFYTNIPFYSCYGFRFSISFIFKFFS